MNMNKISSVIRTTLLGATVGSIVILSACAAQAVKDPGVERVRANLMDLQSDSNLASRAPVAMHDAEAAVAQAEQPQSDPAVTAHLVYLADHKVQIARATAQTSFTEDQRKSISQRNSEIQLDARTREADAAKRANATLQADNVAANLKAGDLQAQTDSANMRNNQLQAQSDSANQKNDALQAQLLALQGKQTDRGMVLTLGDVLFSTGRSDLKAGGTSKLDRLATYLAQAPDRTVRIEGHTDNRGGQALNQALSQRRADSVSAYLTGRGIEAKRVTAVGEGYSSPIADNKTEAGRQANRRVEVIISNPTVAIR
jgi:outer membrane protein OmpA-like peptidoglycan-associated protein